MTPTAELPLNIDSTMISCFRACPQKFYKEFVLGLRPTGLSVDLHAGACFATAMENMYRFLGEGLSVDKALLKTFAVFMDAWGNFQAQKDTPKTRERVWEAVEEYFRTYGTGTDPVQPYMLAGAPAFEFTFGIPLEPSFEPSLTNHARSPQGIFPTHPSGSPFIYCGRFDMLGKWGNKVVVRDEKTTTSIGGTWAQQWELRSQFMGYVWACQQSGLDVDTVCVRGVGILKTKISMAEAFPTFSKVKIARWYEQLRRDLWRIRRCWDENYWDYNFADACSSYGGCVFKEACGSETPEAWHSNFTVRRWNPLNKNPVESEKT